MNRNIKQSLTTSSHPIRAGLAAALILAGANLAAWAQGNDTNPRILPPNAHPFGRTYGQWSEAWFRWCFSLPASHHPIFDTADASAGQSGQVWFIGGNFSGTPVTRAATIPSGTALFVPIFNAWGDNTDCNGSQMISDGLSATDLRQFLRTRFFDSMQAVSCTLDGTPVAGLTDLVQTPYRVQSSSTNGFTYVLPSTDNVLNALGLPCWMNSTGTPITVSASIYHPVAEGYYVMIAPLSVGQHTLHCYGTDGSFTEDFTYNITVVPSRNPADDND